MAAGKRRVSIGVIGVGGGGSNSIANVYDKLRTIGGLDIEFYSINTDIQSFANLGNRKIKQIQIGDKLSGFGAGARPMLAFEAAVEEKQKIEVALEGKNIVFCAAGLGGGTGSGALPVVIEEAKKRGILTIVFSTYPWEFEGEDRKNNANLSLNSLQSYMDSMVIINNDFLNDQSVSIRELFDKTDSFLTYSVLTISSLILERSTINIDFNDIKNVLYRSGFSFFFMFETDTSGLSEQQAIDAIVQTWKSQFISGVEVQEVEKTIVNISGNKDVLTMPIINGVFKKMKEFSPRLQVLFGLSFNDYLEEGVIQISGMFTNVIYTKIQGLLDSKNTLQIKYAAILNEKKKRAMQEENRRSDLEKEEAEKLVKEKTIEFEKRKEKKSGEKGSSSLLRMKK